MLLLKALLITWLILMALGGIGMFLEWAERDENSDKSALIAVVCIFAGLFAGVYFALLCANSEAQTDIGAFEYAGEWADYLIRTPVPLPVTWWQWIIVIILGAYFVFFWFVWYLRR